MIEKPKVSENLVDRYRNILSPSLEIKTNRIRRDCSKLTCMEPIKVGDQMIVVDGVNFYHQLCWHGEHKK